MNTETKMLNMDDPRSTICKPLVVGVGARARGRAHAEAIRNVAWANGHDVGNYVDSPEETGSGCHAFGTLAHAESASALWASVLPHAPLPPRWGLVAREGAANSRLWVVSITDDAGTPVANL